MGKRERSTSAKASKKRPHAARKSKSARDDQQAEPGIPPTTVLDIDEECINYRSDSEHDDAALQSSPKKNARDSNDEASANSSDGDDSVSDSGADLALGEAAADESDVEVGIEFFDPTPADVTPVAAFLDKFAHEAVGTTKERVRKGTSPLNARRLAETVCEQTRVGTMIRVTDEEAPIGFISCLNVYAHRKLLAGLEKKMVEVSGEREECRRFKQIVEKTFKEEGKYENGRMGLVLCERVVNLPPEVVPKMLEALFCEIEWAVEDEPTRELRESFRFGWYLYVTEVYVSARAAPNANEVSVGDADGGGDGVKKQKSKKRRRTTPIEPVAPEVAFTRVEDEVWLEHSIGSTMWDVVGTEAEKSGFERKRMAMIVASGKIAKIRSSVEQLLGTTRIDDGEEGQDGEAGMKEKERKDE